MNKAHEVPQESIAPVVAHKHIEPMVLEKLLPLGLPMPRPMPLQDTM